MTGTMTINQAGHLEIGGCDTVTLARQYGTPLYVMDEEAVRHRAEQYSQSLRGLEDSEIIYAGKALLTVGIAALVKQMGLSLDVVSGGELYAAAQAQFPMEKIYFHGSNKSAHELKMAVDYGVGRIVVDSLYELELLSDILVQSNRECDILLRLTPGVEAHTHSHIQTGQSDSKFGFGIATGQAKAGVEAASKLPNVHLRGIHCHIGSQIFEVSPFKAAVESMMDFLAETNNAGYGLRELDIGGGLGIRHTPEDDTLDIEEYGQFLVKTVRQAAQARGLPIPKLMIEPGRSLVGEAGTTLYAVGTIKELPGIRTYVSVDGGMGDNPRVSLYGAEYTGLAASKMNASETKVYTVAGKCCESGDKLLFDVELPVLVPGDILAVPATGAYNYSMASNYNMLPRPAMVSVYQGESELLVEREQYHDLVRLHRIPERWQ